MQLDRLTPTHVRRAMELYLAQAWPEGEPGQPRLRAKDLEGAHTLEELRPFFETPRSHEKVASLRYTLRLGNYRYPFMKFVVQEYLLEGEFFFSVDTHDELKITPDMPDFEAWKEVRAMNAQLKRSIEEAWAAEGLPTHEALREMLETKAAERREDSGDGGPGQATARLLVADDEQDVAEGLGAMLSAIGYQVRLAFDGHQVLEELSRDPLPDLVILDFSMPGLTGEEVIDQVRRDARTRDLPVLLATATSIDPVGMGGANALLRKPYPQELLFRIIADQLESRRS